MDIEKLNFEFVLNIYSNISKLSMLNEEELKLDNKNDKNFENHLFDKDLTSR